MKIMLLLTVIFLSIPVYGQNVPIMQKSASGDEIHIDFYSACKNRTPILLTSQIADDIEFVPLETTEDCLLGDFMDNIILTKDNIIVFDYKACYLFDRKGKFINKIGTQGNGPGEFTKALSVNVDTLNKWIYFVDHWTQRFIKYDYTGKHIKDLKMKYIGRNSCLYRPMEFVVENQKYIYAKKDKRYSLVFYSEKEQKVISKMKCEYKNNIPGLALSDPISYMYNQKLYIKDFWCDTIYQMTDPFHLKSYAIINRGSFEHRTHNDMSMLTGKEDPNNKTVLEIYRIAETDRYILLSSNKAIFIYDKVLEKTFAGGYLDEFEKLGIQDDLYGSPGIRSDHFPTCVNGNEIYTFRQAYEFIENGDGRHSITDARYDAYRKMVDSLDEDDNPVIMIVKIKR